ncbi:MAG: hybrid sensor histidine kinase/response regulator [Pseudomonadota bacterium]
MSFPFVSASANSAASFMQQVEHATFLVVDDFDAMRRITGNQLRQLGARRILEAANGAEALKILAHQNVTVVLSDWNMPIMSGLDLLTAVRADAKLRNLPFIMITAEAERDKVELAIRTGVSELLVKPYTSARFTERLERCLARKTHAPRPVVALEPVPLAPEPEVPATSTPAADSVADGAVDEAIAAVQEGAERLTILVVDDTPDNLHLISRVFKDEYKVKIAHSGAKALALSQTDTPPDIILLDVMMPEMDGFEVAAKLRAHPSTEHVPIIFITALSDEASRMRGLELGAVDFVSKPVSPDLLRLRVNNFMRYIQLHRQLQVSYDAMLDAARLKEDVDQVTRHDMKGPLAGVIGLLQDVLDVAKLRNEEYEQLRMAEESALLLLDMINLSAEIYKIETGRYKLVPKPVAVGQVLLRLVAIANKTFAAKNVDIALNLPDGTPLEQMLAMGEPMFCYSLFQNLIKNACEAAPQATVVTVVLEMGPQLLIRFENTGVVPQAIREHFFDKFITSGKDGGTGVGTYSAKLLTEAQAGSIAMQTHDDSNRTILSVSLPRA